MTERDPEQRVTMLEQQIRQLDDTPARLAAMESRILHLRRGIDHEISAVHRLVVEGDTEGRRFARVLFEEALARIKLLGDSRDA